ncbi:two-component sensor histidine kinase [Microbispora rosea subsp. aerata]|nr:sensor histidine kinase [Microbispora rosea]GGO23442.1 two-component sensor histidine kinase [Microbispora rosea subsp. aerata]GIH57850.1 two-component sensor histidine kinase [Microbispora rosea subsp. aerata]GLJ84433.1 two-component sensor histidine kinase [Microbispora rosea subsp. aerata]
MSRLAKVLTFGGTDDTPSRLRRLMGTSLGLIYLLYPLSDVTDGRLSGQQAAWRVIALAAFVAVYLSVVLGPRDLDHRPRSMFPLLGVATAMAAAFPLLFRSATWLALPVYLVVVYAMALPPRRAVPGIAAMTALILAEGQVVEADSGLQWSLALQAVTLGVLFMSVRNTRILVAQLRQAQGEAARLAAADERLRIARDLHDLLGHSLSLIVLKSELARRLGEQGSPKAAAEVADIESVARQALAQVREAVSGYRRLHLAEEIEGARSALAAAGVCLAVRTRGTPLPEDLDGLFAWAVREATTNVVRHSRATRCEIDLSYGEEGAVLEIADNGGVQAYEPGNGLTGLGERVRAAGGDLTVEAGQRGFRVLVAVPPPLDRPAGANADRLGR